MVNTLKLDTANKMLADYKKNKLKWTNGKIVQDMDSVHIYNARQHQINYMEKHKKQGDATKQMWVTIFDLELESRQFKYPNTNTTSIAIDAEEDETPIIGVSKKKDSYFTYIGCLGKQVYLGKYKTCKEANDIRRKANEFKKNASTKVEAWNNIITLAPKETARRGEYTPIETLINKEPMKEENTKSIIAGAKVYATNDNVNFIYGMLINSIDNTHFVKELGGDINEYSHIQLEEPSQIITVSMQEIADKFGVNVDQLRISY